jgi:hypothetical protein
VFARTDPDARQMAARFEQIQADAVTATARQQR